MIVTVLAKPFNATLGNGPNVGACCDACCCCRYCKGSLVSSLQEVKWMHHSKAFAIEYSSQWHPHAREPQTKALSTGGEGDSWDRKRMRPPGRLANGTIDRANSDRKFYSTLAM